MKRTIVIVQFNNTRRLFKRQQRALGINTRPKTEGGLLIVISFYISSEISQTSGGHLGMPDDLQH